MIYSQNPAIVEIVRLRKEQSKKNCRWIFGSVITLNVIVGVTGYFL